MKPAVIALSLAVGVVLADSAVVTLALPDILREYETTVGQVSWVLTAFNLVLALAAVPAARLCVRRDPGALGAVGLVVFAACCAVCAAAPSLEVLLAARVVQALGGAVVIAACLELLVAATGSESARSEAVGGGGRGRRRDGAGRRRAAHRGDLLAVDLHRAGAAGAGRGAHRAGLARARGA